MRHFKPKAPVSWSKCAGQASWNAAYSGYFVGVPNERAGFGRAMLNAGNGLGADLRIGAEIQSFRVLSNIAEPEGPNRPA